MDGRRKTGDDPNVEAGSESCIEVDARGLLCPLPVLRLANAMRRTDAHRFRLLATDPDAAADVEAYCRETGCELVLTTTDSGGNLLFEVRRRA